MLYRVRKPIVGLCLSGCALLVTATVLFGQTTDDQSKALSKLEERIKALEERLSKAESELKKQAASTADRTKKLQEFRSPFGGRGVITLINTRDPSQVVGIPMGLVEMAGIVFLRVNVPMKSGEALVQWDSVGAMVPQ